MKRIEKQNEEMPPPETPTSTPSWGTSIIAQVKADRYLQALFVLTLIGAFLRFYHLDYNSLWLDEAATLNFARQSPAEIWQIAAGGEFNPPLFYWIEHLMLIFGDSEFVLRFVPALFGVLTIPLTYSLGKELADKSTGLIAAILLTFSPMHIFYSQDARAYTISVFFVILAALFYIKAMELEDYRLWMLFGIAAAVSFWLHFYTILAIAAILMHALLVSAKQIQERIRYLAVSLATILLLTLPIILVAIPLFAKRTASSPTFGYQGWLVIQQTFSQFSGFNNAIAVAFMLLFILGLTFWFSSDKKKAAFILIFICVPLAMSILMSYRMPFIPRHLLYLLPLFLIGVAYFSYLFMRFLSHKTPVYLLILCLVAVNLPYLQGYYTTYQKEDWRGFSDQLAAMTGDGDIVITVPDYIHLPLDYYYSNISDNTLQFGASSAAELEQISQHKKGNNKVFYVVTADIIAQNPEGDALAWLQDKSRRIWSHTGIHMFTLR
ncbi:MAG: glycosyltransferase family 39 protein [Methanomicrobiales archaeon]|nr:glycosyltransferase family 39 protein [Methanomicrobiales archaeon]MDI6876405.1 glycosyltransferase family 39 protein [Methanomicrobiales archaeon]